MFHYASTLTWLVIGSLVIYFVLWLIAGPLIRKKWNLNTSPTLMPRRFDRSRYWY